MKEKYTIQNVLEKWFQFNVARDISLLKFKLRLSWSRLAPQTLDYRWLNSYHHKSSFGCCKIQLRWGLWAVGAPLEEGVDVDGIIGPCQKLWPLLTVPFVCNPTLIASCSA